MYRKIALGWIIDPRGPSLRASSHAINSEAALRAGSSHPPVEVGQAIILEELRRIGVVAAGHPSVEAAVIVGHLLAVVQVYRAALFEAYVVRDGDQVRLVFHGAKRVLVEVDEKLLSGEALPRRHDDLVTAVSPDLHAVRNLAAPT